MVNLKFCHPLFLRRPGITDLPPLRLQDQVPAEPVPPLRLLSRIRVRPDGAGIGQENNGGPGDREEGGEAGVMANHTKK